MKRTLLTSINSVLSTGVCAVLNSCANALTLDDNKTETWTRLGKWHEYPGHINLPGGIRKQGLQVLDRDGAEAMRKTFYSALNQIAHLGKGLPIYEGHPDDPAWRKENPEVRMIAVGRIKDMEIREDGPWVRCVFNERGVKLIGGDAPELSAHSPHFGLGATSDSGKFRVQELRSIGLTNNPNMPDTAIGLNDQSTEIDTQKESTSVNQKPKTKKHVKLNPETMTSLGLSPEASEESTNSAVNAQLANVATLTATVAKSAADLTSANELVTRANASRDKYQGICIETKLVSAVNNGRITEADKPKWEQALKTDFEGESKKLDSLMGTSLNTADKIGDVKNRKEEGNQNAGGISAINSAVASYAKEHGLDLSKGSEYQAAFSAIQHSKPELFA